MRARDGWSAQPPATTKRPAPIATTAQSMRTMPSLTACAPCTVRVRVRVRVKVRVMVRVKARVRVSVRVRVGLDHAVLIGVDHC